MPSSTFLPQMQSAHCTAGECSDDRQTGSIRAFTKLWGAEACLISRGVCRKCAASRGGRVGWRRGWESYVGRHRVNSPLLHSSGAINPCTCTEAARQLHQFWSLCVCQSQPG